MPFKKTLECEIKSSLDWMVVETNTKILLTEERQVKVLKAENRPQAQKYLFGR